MELGSICQEYIDFIDNDKEYCEDGLDNYQNAIFESAIDLFFKEDVLDWINKRRLTNAL